MFLTAGDTDIFSALPANYFIWKPIGNEELIKLVNEINNNAPIQKLEVHSMVLVKCQIF